MKREDYPWIDPTKYKPSDDEKYLVVDRDNEHTVSSYDVEDRVWLDKDYNVVDVMYYMRIPDVEY